MKLYYKQDSGYICNLYPYYIKPLESDPYIEITDNPDEPVYEDLTYPELNQDLGYTYKIQDNQIVQIKYEPYFLSREHYINMYNFTLRRLRRRLSETDYIVTKIHEAMIEDDDDEVATLKQKYATELAQRKEYRKQINETEQLLKEVDKYPLLKDIPDENKPTQV